MDVLVTTLQDELPPAKPPRKILGMRASALWEIALFFITLLLLDLLVGSGTRFIALEMGQLGGAGRTVIDLVGRQGERMRVEVAGGVDLSGLVQAFWSRQP